MPGGFAIDISFSGFSSFDTTDRVCLCSTFEPITGYRIEEDFCQPAGACTVTGANRRQLHVSNDSSILTFLKTGIDAAYTFKFYIQAENVAGVGEFGEIEVISLFFPSKPQNFTGDSVWCALSFDVGHCRAILMFVFLCSSGRLDLRTSCRFPVLGDS